MMSESQELMVEVQKLEVLFRVLGVRFEARWIPSATNRFTDSLSKTWDPNDFGEMKSLVAFLGEENGLDTVDFWARPCVETKRTRLKYFRTKITEN